MLIAALPHETNEDMPHFCLLNTSIIAMLRCSASPTRPLCTLAALTKPHHSSAGDPRAPCQHYSSHTAAPQATNAHPVGQYLSHNAAPQATHVRDVSTLMTQARLIMRKTHVGTSTTTQEQTALVCETAHENAVSGPLCFRSRP